MQPTNLEKKVYKRLKKPECNRLRKFKKANASKMKFLKTFPAHNGSLKMKENMQIRRLIKKAPRIVFRNSRRIEQLSDHLKNVKLKRGSKNDEPSSDSTQSADSGPKTMNKGVLYHLFLSFSLSNKKFCINRVDFELLKIILKNCEIFSEEVFDILLKKILSKSAHDDGNNQCHIRISSQILNQLREQFLSGTMSLDKSIQLLLRNFGFFLSHCLKSRRCVDNLLSVAEIRALLGRVKFFSESFSGDLKIPDLLQLENELNMNLKEMYFNKERAHRLKYIRVFCELQKEANFKMIFYHFLDLLRNPHRGKDVYLLLGKQIKNNVDHLESITRKMLNLGLGWADLKQQIKKLFELKIVQEIESFIQIREAAETVNNKWFI